MTLSGLLKDGSRRELLIENLWPHKNWLVLKFAGVESISDAEALKGAELQLPRVQRGQLESGWTYLSDLCGSTVFEGDREIGRITEVRFGAGEAPLLVVRGDSDREFEIPFAEEYLVKVDTLNKVIQMRLPDGMLEINDPPTKDERDRRR